MPTYVALLRLTEEGREDLDELDEIVEALSDAVRGAGGAVQQGWAVLGAVDLVVVMDLPDNEAAFAVAAAVNRMEAFSTETYPAMPLGAFADLASGEDGDEDGDDEDDDAAEGDADDLDPD